MSGIIKGRKHYPLAVNGYTDHVHILIDFNVEDKLSDLVREVKKASTKFIKENKLLTLPFHWQTGYGVFSVSSHQKHRVINYILNQEAHHMQKTFREEYMAFLKDSEIAYDERYLFEFYDNEETNVPDKS